MSQSSDDGLITSFWSGLLFKSGLVAPKKKKKPSSIKPVTLEQSVGLLKMLGPSILDLRYRRESVGLNGILLDRIEDDL
jgi:hypothetical protein